jgi:hypothetical protein
MRKKDNPWQIDLKNKNSERFLAVGVGALVKFRIDYYYYFSLGSNFFL